MGLDTKRQVVLGRTMLIRAEELKDWTAVHAVKQSAFETPTEARLVDVLREQVRPVVSLFAEEDGSIRGYIMFLPDALLSHVVFVRTLKCTIE